MVRFPSVEWFDAVTRAHAADPERLKRLGYVEAKVGVLVEDGAATKAFLLDFAGFAPRAAAEVRNPLDSADFTIAGPLLAWRDMIDNIAAEGEADLAHTLNRLTMAGTPLRVVGRDQLEEDLFFRFNQSFQAYFDASARVVTEYAVLAPA
jgi:hypothetical protein